MPITIKRKDSVTSILLFIFNVFLVERGITAIPLKKIFKLMEPFQKNETAIRMGLSRELQNGVLTNRRENGEVVYALTETVLAGFKTWMKTMDHDHNRIRMQLRAWDGLWRQVLLGKEIDQRSDLENITELLLQLGFGTINKNCWISPYDYRQELSAQLSDSEFGSAVYLLEGRVYGGKTPAQLAGEIWPIAKLNKDYHQFMASFESEAACLDIAAYHGGGGLPFLHRFGLEFFEIVRNDPHLPMDLLPPDWAGIRSAAAFKNIREAILPKADAFIRGILES